MVTDSIVKQPRASCSPPSLRANGSRECAPDDRLREAIHEATATRKQEWILRRVTSPACGGGRRAKRDGWGKAYLLERRVFWRHPHPNPPPQAGEGARNLACIDSNFQIANSRYISTFSRRDAPEFCLKVSPSENQRAQGKPGARCTRSLAWWVENTRVSHHRFTGITRPSLRNGFNGLFRALLGDRACLPPSPARSLLLENLTPASGRQDHTTSPSARNVIRLLTCRVHRIPCPTSVTIAKRPSCGTGWAGYSR